LVRRIWRSTTTRCMITLLLRGSTCDWCLSVVQRWRSKIRVRSMSITFSLVVSSFIFYRRVKIKTEKAMYADEVEADSSVK
jgi:hypothetical protein